MTIEMPKIIFNKQIEMPKIIFNTSKASEALTPLDYANMKASLPKNRTGEQLEEGARLWQAEAYNKWLGLEKPRMCVSAATGSGKTRLAITVMHNWLHETGHHNTKTGQPVVVFVVPSKQLLNQTRTTVRMWKLTCGRIGGGYNERSPNKDVYITTYLSLKKVQALAHLHNRPILIVLDECHRAGGEVALRTLRNFQGDGCLLLSATPNRSDGVCVMCEMNTSPAGSVCSGEDCDIGIQFHLKLIDGIKQSRNGDDELDFTFHLVHINMTTAEQIQYDDLTGRISKLFHKCYKIVSEEGGNANNLFARSNWGLSGEARQALGIYQARCNERKRLMNEMENRFDAAQQVLTSNIGKKYALFHETIFGIERLNGMCKNIGISPHVYHSGVTTLPPHVYQTYPELNNPAFKRRLAQYGEDATKELKRWERSTSDILLTCKSLKEGFDAPDMDGVIMMSGTNNVRSRIQTIGRVFRGAKHKDIWMFVYNDTESGDYRSFYNLIHDTGIPHEKIRYHTNGINPAHIVHKHNA
jgi:superfamily II DNA or RNA helicase